MMPEEERRWDLTDLTLDEVSVVGPLPGQEGNGADNPGARILLTKKAADEAHSRTGWDERLSQVVDELIREEKAGVGKADDQRRSMTTQLQKRSDVTREVGRLAHEKMQKAAGAENLTVAQARMEVWMENPELQRLYQELEVETAAEMAAQAEKHAPVKKGGDVLQKHRAAVAELRKSHPDKALSELKVMAWDRNPDLVSAYQDALRS